MNWKHAASAAMVVLASYLGMQSGAWAQNAMQGSVVVEKRGEATLHTYVAPLDKASNTTHIIETASGLVVVDAQFYEATAKEAAAYVRSLNKPVLRLLITHQHPDHWSGLAEFGDVPSAALTEVQDFVNGEQGSGMFASTGKRLGDKAPKQRPTIKNAQAEGSETLGGIEYQFVKVRDAEADVQLLVRIPAIQTLIVQDLVYNDAHHVVGALRAPDPYAGWLQALTEIKRQAAQGGYVRVLPGHGKPADVASLDASMAYVNQVRALRALAASPEDFKSRVLAAYPKFSARDMLGLTTMMLFRAPATDAVAPPAARQLPLDAVPDGAILRKVTAQPQEQQGRRALRVELTDAATAGKPGVDFGDLPTFVQIPANLKDGTVELDMFAKRNGKGPTDARAFVGLAYRVNADASRYESVYLRPLNGRKLNPPAPRDRRAVQYYAYPDWKFDRLRQEYPDGRFEAGADIRDGEWIALKLELDGTRVRVFVNGQQVMDNPESKITPAAGGLGLWVDIGTEAWFHNLRFTAR